MKKIALLLVMSLLLSLVACGSNPADPSTDQTTSDGSGEDPAAESDPPAAEDEAPAAEGETTAGVKDTIRVQTVGGSGNLDVNSIIFYGFRWVIESLYEPLWTYGYEEDTEFDYVLATGMEKTSDTERVVHLREGVTFSNGNPFNADDVLFTLGLYKERAQLSTFVQDVDLENCEKIDEYTVRIAYTRPNRTQDDYFVQIVMLDGESYYDGLFDENAIGTGAYELVSFSPYDRLELRARPDYWGGEPAIKNVIGVQVTETSQATNALLAGELDVITQAALSEVEYYRSLDNVQVISEPMNRGAWLEFNTSSESVFNDVNARLAVAWAVDRQEIIDIAWNGQGTMAKSFFPASFPDYDEQMYTGSELYQNGPDMEKAREYAELAGLVGQEIVFVHNGNVNQSAACQIMQERLGQLGINVTIQPLDPGTFMEFMPSNKDSWDIYFAHGEGYSVPNFLAFNIVGNVRSVLEGDLREQLETYLEAANSEMDDALYKERVLELVNFVNEQCIDYGTHALYYAVAGNAELKNFDRYMYYSVMIKDLSW